MIDPLINTLAEHRDLRPSLNYVPGRRLDLDGNPVRIEDNGQWQFHHAPHVIRLAAPGNGWGKTAVIAVEVDWWGHGDHPAPYDVPIGRPRQMIWIAQKHQQWELMRPSVEAWWPESVRHSWVGQPQFRYTWPDKSTLTIITNETDWTTVMGIQPDLVVGDEEINKKLATEMLKRRRGNTRTRFVFNGTAVQGLSWAYRDLYLPWRKFHENRGVTSERDMMAMQLHDYGAIDPELKGVPGIWCWPTGSHADNPTATRQTWAFYKATTMGSPTEQMVRLYGGFRDFAGQPVFDLEVLESMRPELRAGKSGSFVKAD